MNATILNSKELNGSRYYYMIAFQMQDYNINNYWKNLKINKSEIKEAFLLNFQIQFANYFSDIRFHNGEDNLYVENSENSPPYKYELFAINLIDYKTLIVGFPFKSLARRLIEILTNKSDFKFNIFIKPNLNQLIKIQNNNIEFEDIDKGFRANFSSLSLILTEETNISSVNLDGDRPTDSKLYKDVFLNKIENNQCMLEKCTLKCESFQDSKSTKANIHLDTHGNIKTYLHGAGRNIISIPQLLDMFFNEDCITKTSLNPLNKLNENEQF